MNKRLTTSMFVLFAAVVMTAGGYGATFLLTDYFRSIGGNEIDTGWILVGAAFGTLIGVPAVGWFAPHYGAIQTGMLGSICVGLGFYILSTLNSISSTTQISGFLIGLGWGAFYLSAPIAVSERVADANRVFWFMWLGAAQMSGIGLGPVLLSSLSSQFLFPIGDTFKIVAGCCFVSTLLVGLSGAIQKRELPASGMRTDWVRSIAAISRTHAILPILMVFLGACIFTSVLTFQSSIALVFGFDKSIFLVAYTVTVVVSRFVLASIVSRSDADNVAVLTLLLMSFGIAILILQNANLVFYIVSAVLLGLGYGLAYSVIQTQAVNDAPEDLHSAALTWFVLSYFVGVFGFPIVAGFVIVQMSVQAMMVVLLLLASAELAVAIWGRYIRRAAKLHSQNSVILSQKANRSQISGKC